MARIVLTFAGKYGNDSYALPEIAESGNLEYALRLLAGMKRVREHVIGDRS